ncbi:MAG: hypothetical protein IIB76_00055 [Proteobacteria bacterium]|nr:hypothetical protein [Pseudomonadota bacterium]
MNESDHDKFDDELMARASALPQDIQPQRDLWSGIATAIAKPPAVAPWNRFMAQAAAVLVLVGGSSGLTYFAVTDDDRAAVDDVVQTPELIFRPVSGSFGSRYMLGPGYQDAHSVLASQLDLEMQRLSTEARQDVHTNLTIIRTAIADINRALADEPDNTLLQKLLLSSYQEELSVMKQVNGITSAVMFREDF